MLTYVTKIIQADRYFATNFPFLPTQYALGVARPSAVAMNGATAPLCPLASQLRCRQYSISIHHRANLRKPRPPELEPVPVTVELVELQ